MSSTCERLLPLLLCSFQLRFQMLKAWMINPDLSNINVEEKYQQYAEELRTDRYVTVPWLRNHLHQSIMVGRYWQCYCGKW